MSIKPTPEVNDATELTLENGVKELPWPRRRIIPLEDDESGPQEDPADDGTATRPAPVNPFLSAS
jgi:hypothetical protein